MSTQIFEISGRYESDYEDSPIFDISTLYVTRFFGGKENGAMIQITISNERDTSYVQLTKKQIEKLTQVLKDAYNYEKYPSE